jgi:hypothetical protein
MTEKDKKLEEKVFSQEVSHDELKSVSGGDCGRTAFVDGPCPKGVFIKQICPDNTTYGNLEEISKPGIDEPLFKEVEIEEPENPGN